MLSNSYLFISIFGILVLIAFNIFLYCLYNENIQTKKKNYELKNFDNIYFEKKVHKKEEEFFLNNVEIEKDNILMTSKTIKKYAILVAYDYQIQFVSLKNSEKLDDYARFLNQKVNISNIYIFKNNFEENIKEKIINTLQIINNMKESTDTEKILFLHFFSLCTCIKIKKEIQNAICIGNDLLYQNELNQQFTQFKNFKIFCGFEPSSNINCFLPLAAEIKSESQFNEKDTARLWQCKEIPVENYNSYSQEGNEMLTIPIDFTQSLRPVNINFVNREDIKKKLNYKYNYNNEKKFSMDSLVHCMSHSQLAYFIKAAFSMNYVNGDNIDFLKLNNFLLLQNVKQSTSFP